MHWLYIDLAASSETTLVCDLAGFCIGVAVSGDLFHQKLSSWLLAVTWYFLTALTCDLDRVQQS